MQRTRTASHRPTHLFSDIHHHWAKDCIAELARKNLIKGDRNRRFRPDAPMTRGEFAALMYWVFPHALPVREPQPFSDVPVPHWANRVVKWVYERGLFTGYANQTFRPDHTLSRSQAFVVLVKGLNYVLPVFPQAILDDYFDDAIDVPVYAAAAIAAATLSSLVVNYPNVRKLRPNQPITRGEVAAILCQVFERSHPVPRPYVPWSLNLESIHGKMAVSFGLLKGNARLVKQIQTRLHALRLYPDHAPINGNYNPSTEAALMDLCHVLERPNRQTYVLDESLAQLLLTLDPVCFILEQARNRETLFKEYLAQEQGFNAATLAFLDKGIHGSPYEAEITHYPTYLWQAADELSPPSLHPSAELARFNNKPETPGFDRFPRRGNLPPIQADGLSFLHSDIQQACVCIGEISNGQIKSRWFGKDALANVELWSATKMIPLLHVVSKVNSSFSAADIDHEMIRSHRSRSGFSFHDLAVDMVNYKSSIGSSNSLAAMLKQFDTPHNLESWLKAITGNTRLEFRGRYGEGAFIQSPELWDQRLQKVVLTAQQSNHRGQNSISTYDLTRLITMLAWHPHLPSDAQLPGTQWHSLESVVRAMGVDSARYVDVAIARLGLQDAIAAPVIISKLGFGRSRIRHQTELVYSAFVQFLDNHQCSRSVPSQAARRRSVGMTLIGAKRLGDGDREAIELDARMAAEVTEILRRVVTDELI
ncbi:S-layer homology domain-containing protein [Oculatella sp. LEGE 06141]|uniref:S-layer homology domain-containing protein n=1 Tax=Oculatella sp. LEGE 06141 TaxID=1828648 RepID=UPI00187DFAEF|nr:S-layer homology domain-containing protein [Oculatella sp. LEGE 06141]MBE9181520.1 S-layer homology domain-containing protein [Oculatella sp. LEGE 06141]